MSEVLSRIFYLKGCKAAVNLKTSPNTKCRRATKISCDLGALVRNEFCTSSSR